MSVRRLIEASKGCVPCDIELVSELCGRLFRQIGDGGEQLFVPLLERPLNALVQLLIAAGRLYRPDIASSDNGRVLRVEVEGEVDLVEGAEVEILRGSRISYIIPLALSPRKHTFIAPSRSRFSELLALE